jgi:hypothetical protein
VVGLFGGVAHLVGVWSERGAGAIVWQILIGLAYLIAALYMERDGSFAAKDLAKDERLPKDAPVAVKKFARSGE